VIGQQRSVLGTDLESGFRRGLWIAQMLTNVKETQFFALDFLGSDSMLDPKIDDLIPKYGLVVITFKKNRGDFWCSVYLH